VFTAVTSVSEVIVIFLLSILFVDTAAFVYSLLGLVSHSFWEGDSGEEITRRWLCLKVINHSHDSWLVLTFKKPTNRLVMPIAALWIVSFFLEKYYIPQYYRLLTCYVCARLCQCFCQGGCYFRCDKPCTCSSTPTQLFCHSTVAHILTPSVDLAFGPKSGFKNNCRARSGFGLVISGSGRVQASKWGPFTILCGYVCRGQPGKIERIRPPPTNSKYRVKLFCEVGYANFRPNVFGAGKRISMEILVGVWLHEWWPVALKMFVVFSKNGNV